MVSRTLEERLAKAKKAVRDTRWWVVVFKYCIEAALLLLFTLFLSFVVKVLLLKDISPFITLFSIFALFVLWSMLLNVLIRWMF